MTHEELLKATMQYGFSAVIAVYVLVRMEARLQQLTEAIVQLKNCMEVKIAKFEEAIRRCDQAHDRCEQRDAERILGCVKAELGMEFEEAIRRCEQRDMERDRG